MVPEARQRYNRSFSEEKYGTFLADLDASNNFHIPFRVAESPVFIPRGFRDKLFEAADGIINVIVRDDFKKLTQKAIPNNCNVPNETAHTLFLALDFAIVKDKSGQLQPQLIEMQGFPSLFGFQDFLSKKFRDHFDIPESYSSHFGLSSDTYRQKFTSAVVGNHDPENVILLELDPMKQNTAVDFLITEKITGVRPVHLGDVEREGRKLFYRHEGRRIPIERIYNRVIFDELISRPENKFQYNLTEDVNVEWAGHPNWFFRISKYTMPFINSPYIPECKFLSQYDSFPTDLRNYVLKPLFSFSGSGVIFNLTKEDLDAIPARDYENFMLQRKVQYEPVIQSPDGLVKTEVRILFFWEEGQLRPVPVTNLARLSRGEMIGVKFNKDKTWVGGSVCFFEP